MVNKTCILDKVKAFYNLKGNKELADFLGVNKQTISNWYSRKTLDYDIILSKCKDIDLHWLFLEDEKKEQEANKIILSTLTQTVTEVLNKNKNKNETIQEKEEDPLLNLLSETVQKTIKEVEKTNTPQKMFKYLLSLYNEEENYNKDALLYFKLNYIIMVFTDYAPEAQFYELYLKSLTEKDKTYLHEGFYKIISKAHLIGSKLANYETEINQIYNLTKEIAKKVGIIRK